MYILNPLLLKWIQGAQAIIITFDLVDKDSLIESETWLNDALKVSTQHNATNKPLIFLVGTKKDLIDFTCESNREDTNILANTVAQRINAEYWQVSSLTGENVKKFFYRLASILFNGIIRNELTLSKESNGYKRSIDKSSFVVKLNGHESKMSQTTSLNLQSK